MNLLSKLNSNSKVKSIEPREIFMTLPAKAPGYGYPRDVQSEVWKKWFELRNQKNVILKMNTGSGKTVVGLVMLQSCLNEDKGPAIYVVPDNYLVKQVIEEAKNWEYLQLRIKMIIVIRIQKQFLLQPFKLLSMDIAVSGCANQGIIVLVVLLLMMFMHVWIRLIVNS